MPTTRSIIAGSPPQLSSCSLNGEILSMPDRDAVVDQSKIVSYNEHLGRADQGNADENKENITIIFRQAKSSRTAVVSATVAHILAWAAFLWIAFWPHSYQGVSAAAVSVDGSGITTSEVVRYTRSFTDVNGYWILIPLFVPVLVTAMALLSLLTWKGGRVGNTLILAGLALILLVFCVLGILSFGIFYLPAAIASIATAAVYGLRLGAPKLNDEGKQ